MQNAVALSEKFRPGHGTAEIQVGKAENPKGRWFPTAWNESELQPKLRLPVELPSLHLRDAHSQRTRDCGIPELPGGNEAPKRIFGSVFGLPGTSAEEVLPLPLWRAVGTEIFRSRGVCGMWDVLGGLGKG